MAEIVTTINSTTDFSSWVAGLPANLVTDGNSYTAEISNAAELVFTTGFTFSQTTDASHFITIRAKAGNSFRDAGDGPLKYSPARGAAMNFTTDYAVSLKFAAGYSVLQGVQLLQQSAYALGTAQLYGTNGLLDGCLFQGASRSGYGLADIVGGGSILKNSAILVTAPPSTGSLAIAGGYGGQVVDGCTLICPSDAAYAATACDNYGGTMTVRNTAIFGFGSGFTGSSFASDGHNATDLASAPGTTGNLLSATFANQFVGATLATLDARLKSGSILIDAGIASANLPTDIFKTARPQGSAPDIGCYELASAAPPASRRNLILNIF